MQNEQQQLVGIFMMWSQELQAIVLFMIEGVWYGLY